MLRERKRRNVLVQSRIRTKPRRRPRSAVWPRRILVARNGGMARPPRLRGKPDRRIGGAEALIVAPLYDLEKEQVLEALRVKLQIFAGFVLIVEDISGLQAFEQVGR